MTEKIRLQCVAPSHPKRADGKDIRRMRDDLHLSQNGLALAMGVSKRTVEAWEAGKSNPSNVANKLLYLIEKKRELLDLLILPKTS
jgi:putative transcriptional regulator